MRISIFDYDNTLKLTASKPPLDWSSVMSSVRSRGSLWNEEPGSLLSPTGDRAAWVESVVAAAKDRAEDPFTVSVLMTARDKNAEKIVFKDLTDRGLCFDAYFYRDDVPLLDSDFCVIKDEMDQPIMKDQSPALYKLTTTWCIASWMSRGEILYPGFEPMTRMLPLGHVDEIEVFEDNQDNIDGIEMVCEKLGCLFTPRHISIVSEGWRTAGDRPLPGDYNKGAPKVRRPPKDPTYGSEPDLLDKPGVIVEPDVRKKISDYFAKMRLREMIRSLS